MPNARVVEPGRAGALDKARDEVLDTVVLDRAVPSAGHDDQVPAREQPTPAAQVRRGIERVGATGQQQRRPVHDSTTGSVRRYASLRDDSARVAEEPGTSNRRLGEVAPPAGTRGRRRVRRSPTARSRG